MNRRALFAWLVGASLLALTISPSSLPRVLAAPAGPRVLTGDVPDVVRSGDAQLISPVDGSTTISLAIGLAVRDPQGLQQFVQDVNDPASPQFGQYLSQDEANQRFNPTSDQENQVISWLQSYGLTVTRTYPNHLLVDAQGTVKQVQALLDITISRYSAKIHGSDTTFFAPDGAPTISGSVSSIVTSVVGLDSVPRFHKYSNGSPHGSPPYYPQDFADAYDVNPLWNAGDTGTGQHIGITLWETPPSDTTLGRFHSVTYANVATVGNGRLKVIKVDGGTTATTSGDDGEAGLDVETSSGMAPGATIDYYEAPTDGQGNPTDQGLLDALNIAGSDTNNNRQISSSWGGCEANPIDSWTSSAENIFASNSATGHNYFFSSGDNGSWCDPNNNGTGVDPYPDYPASSPLVTSVGGTSFEGNISTISPSYPGETAWAYCSTCNNNSPEGSGGGYSTIFSRPSWQTASTLLANGHRGYPDISAVGDPATGAYVCFGTTSTSCGQIGGTSLSSPMLAGMTALINQYLTSLGKAALTFLDPLLYKIGTTTQAHVPFNDVASGTNGKYNATGGWDAVTGWGSPNLWNLAQDIAGVGTGSGGNATPTKTPTPRATATPRPTSTPTMTPLPLTQLLSNPGFETGLAPWTTSTADGHIALTTARAHTGTQSVVLCGYNSCSDTLAQTLTVPSSFSKLTLTYWLFESTVDVTYCADTLAPQVFDGTTSTLLASAPRLCNTNTYMWVQKTADLTTALATHKGQQVTLEFTATSNSLSPTTFYIDDVGFNVQ